MHSQNKEAEIVLDYFNGYIGTLLDVGANDGITFSNSYDLLQTGWKGYLLEPGKIYKKASDLYRSDMKRVKVWNFGIGLKTEKIKFYESGTHIPNGIDKGLVSSTNYEETIKWRNSGVEFNETEIALLSFNDFYGFTKDKKLDFISIDTEGNDWNVLQQIDLKKVGCTCLCIEWNGDKTLFDRFTGYIRGYGLREIYRSAENLIFAI